MGRAAVARPVKGITLNSEWEFLLDDSSEVRLFDSGEQARSFLAAAGIEPEELRHMSFIENYDARRCCYACLGS